MTRALKTLPLSILLAALLAGGALRAQQPAAPLSLADCLALARTHQVDLLTGRQRLVGAQANVTQARSSYYPQASATWTPLATSGGTGKGLAQTGIGLTIRQTFFDGGLREEGVKSARAGLAQSEASLQRSAQTVTFNVTSAYYSALRQQHLAAVAEAKVKSLEGQLTLVRARIEAGDAARAEELPIKAQLANAIVDQLTGRNAIRTALVSLQSAIGLPARDDFAIQDVGAPIPGEAGDLDGYVKAALAARPDLAASQAARAAAQSSVKTARINLQPRLVSDGQYNFSTLGSDSSTWAVNAGVACDLFDGQRNRAALASAKAGAVSAALEDAQLRKDIAAQVQQAWLNLTNARERIAAAALGAEAAQSNFDAQSARYTEGLATPLDLVNAQVDLATAQNNAVGAQYDYYVAQAQLDYALGTQGGSNAK